MDLKGNYQQKNLAGILQTINILQKLGYRITLSHIKHGLGQIVKNTGLKGRWQVLGKRPWVICDTGHNEDGIRYIIEQINESTYNQLYMVIGMVNDKEVSKVLDLLPKDAQYIFCQANIPRAMEADLLAIKAASHGLKGIVIRDVNEAIGWAKQNASVNDLIFIGGSTFVVAEINDL
jgi:dihydrofolate synthase/folylpolyglutamate synthase